MTPPPLYFLYFDDFALNRSSNPVEPFEDVEGGGFPNSTKRTVTYQHGLGSITGTGGRDDGYGRRAPPSGHRVNYDPSHV